MNVSNRLSSDDEGSSNGSGDDNLVESFNFNIAQPPPVAAAQKQLSEYANIMELIENFNEMKSDINILFLIFNRINLALDNKTLTESQADSLYRNITELCTFGNVNLTLAQVTEIGKMFKNASQGTARDLDLLTTMLRQNGVQVVQQVVATLESTTLPFERIFDSEKAVAAMMRLCRTLSSLGVKNNKCDEFNSRLLRGGMDMDSVARISQQEINLNEFTINEFAIVIQEMIRQRRSHVREEEERQRARTQREQQRRQLERQQHEDNVMKARLMFHKGGTVIQKKQSQSKKYKQKNIRKSKYNKPKNQYSKKTHKKYCKNKTKKRSK
jgi:hypothetical protein